MPKREESAIHEIITLTANSVHEETMSLIKHLGQQRLRTDTPTGSSQHKLSFGLTPISTNYWSSTHTNDESLQALLITSHH